ncbi:MAG: 2-oxoacid:acceptor oxidoreductase subunit alpha [archaeon]
MTQDRQLQFMLGNYAIVEGAIAAGCRYYAGYPITPANEISEWMAQRMPEVGGRFIQMEDELGSIYSVCGASLAGVKSMTATASAGYNYMQEGIEYAVSAEIPIVIVDVMRQRGENYPTQSDVMQARYGAAGDHEMIVLTPSSVQELFELTFQAFNLAERFRNPVIVLSEATISLMREAIKIPSPEELVVINRKKPVVAPEQFMPFRGEEDLVPRMSEFGDQYKVLYTHNPHDEWGRIAWTPKMYEDLYDRITKKIANKADEIAMFETHFTDDAEIVVIAYGSEARGSIEGVRIARDEGIKAGMLKLKNIWPVPEKAMRDSTKHAKKVLVPEMNTGRYFHTVKEIVGCDAEVIPLLKNQGRIHSPEEILEAIRRAK